MHRDQTQRAGSEGAGSCVGVCAPASHHLLLVRRTHRRLLWATITLIIVERHACTQLAHVEPLRLTTRPAQWRRRSAHTAQNKVLKNASSGSNDSNL